MPVRFSSVLQRGLIVVSALLAGALTGCGTGVLAGPSDSAGVKINGNVHGGAYPIQGATIRLMETQSNGSWSTVTNSYSGTAKQLLQTTSDSAGFFTFPDTGWTCDAGQYAYITVTGGHTAAANNYNVIQVGVIGGCSTDLANKTEIDNVNVFISELSTVAAAYALGNFITIDNSKASSGQQIVNITAPAANNSTTPGCNIARQMTCSHAGLANAFGNAYNLVDQVTYGANQSPTGMARTALPGNAQGLVPQALINTLGNILQSCVDSGGGTVASYGSYVPGNAASTRCGDLFYWATAPGSTTPPVNTLQVALNMARYPTHNVDNLFRLQPRAVFFTPDMMSDTMSGNSAQLMSFTLSIFYVGTGLPSDAGMPYPVDVALDGTDNAYVLYSGGASGTTYAAVDEFSPNGAGVFQGSHLAALPNPGSIALDSGSTAWITNDASSNGNLFQINTPGSGGAYGAIGQTITVANGFAAGVAIDLSDNVWVSRDATDLNQSLFRFRANRSYASTNFLLPPVANAPIKRLVVDTNQNVLAVTSGTSPLGTLLTGTSASVVLYPYGSNGGTSALTAASLSAKGAYDIAVSNSDTAYVPLYQQLNTETGYANGTMAANGAGSYTGMSSTNQTYTTPMGVRMDGTGNLFWSDWESQGQIFWFQPSSTTSVSSGTLTSVVPCFPVSGQCASSASSFLRGMAIDSSGALWYLANGTTGEVVQTLGLAAPTFPLLSYAHAGIIVQ